VSGCGTRSADGAAGADRAAGADGAAGAAGAESVTILVADDHPLYRRGLAELLAGRPGWSVVAQAEDGLAAVTESHAHDPDVVVMDLNMPKVDGIEATRRIVAASPRVGVLVLTMYDDDDSVFAAMRAGARGYVLKGADQADIVRAVETVSRGEAIFGPSVATRIVEFFAAPRRAVDPTVFPGLSQREHDVLDLIAAGRKNADIAASLSLSEKTVRNHVTNIFAKLQVADRAEAIVRAREAGLGR
jgi:DNA-binding NarL/FixJ family response regulator